MSTVNLKLTALIFMVIDHIGNYIPGIPFSFRWIGRMSSPIFLFCAVWGCHYTHNLKRYLQRLYFGSILMGVLKFVLNNFLFIEKKYQYIEGNIFHSLFEIILFIYIIEESKKYKTYKKLILFFLWQIITCSLFLWCEYNYFAESIIEDIISPMVGSIFFMEGGVMFFLMGIIIYFTKDNPIKLVVGYLSSIALITIMPMVDIMHILRFIYSDIDTEWVYTFFNYIVKVNPLGAITPSVSNLLTVNYSWIMIVALPFMLLYNNQKGRSYKYFFYVFYPLHISILYILGNLIFLG